MEALTFVITTQHGSGSYVKRQDYDALLVENGNLGRQVVDQALTIQCLEFDKKRLEAEVAKLKGVQ